MNSQKKAKEEHRAKRKVSIIVFCIENRFLFFTADVRKMSWFCS